MLSAANIAVEQAVVTTEPALKSTTTDYKICFQV